MSTTDDLLKNNEASPQGFDKGDLPLPPARKIADRRLHGRPPEPVSDPRALELGDAHVIRNAGGVITDDEIRSLAISQHLLGTEEIMLIHHTDCGMLTFNDRSSPASSRRKRASGPSGMRARFRDLDQDVRDSIKRIKDSPFIPRTDSVRGFVYDVETGRAPRGELSPGPPPRYNGFGEEARRTSAGVLLVAALATAGRGAADLRR